MSAMKLGVLLCLLLPICLCSVACTREQVCRPPWASARAGTVRSQPVSVADSTRLGAGTITGEFFDVKTKMALAGVTVSLLVEGIGRGVVTNEHGEFLMNVDPGAFGLAAICLGYNDTLIVGTVAAGCTLHLHVGLRTMLIDFRGQH